MKKLPESKRYLINWGGIVNSRVIDYPKDAKKKIILCLIKGGMEKSKSEAAFKETKECVSRLAGLFLPKNVSEEEVKDLTKKLSDKLNTTLSDKQTEKLKRLIEKSLSQKRIFGKEITARSEKAALKAIQIASQTRKPSSVEENKLWLSRKQELKDYLPKIKDFFSKDIEGPYEDPLTIRGSESIQRFNRLYKISQSLEKELCFFLKNDLHHDTIQLKRVFNRLINLEPFINSRSLKIPREIRNTKESPNKRHEIETLLKKSLVNQLPYPIPHITLQKVADLICYLKSACYKLKENPGRFGIKNLAFRETIIELADVWEKYTKTKPDRSKKEGKFLLYIKLAIQSIIPFEKSLNDTARKAMNLRNKPVAKISSR